MEAMRLDKKVISGGQRWVLLRDVGKTEVCTDVSTTLIQRVLEECIA
jgi:3-dehydroquinate synthetase